MPDQCGASGEVHTERGEDNGVQYSGWQWGSGGHGAVCGGRGPSVLRQHDCQADLPWEGSRRVDGQDAAGAVAVCRAGNSYDDSATPEDLCRCGVPGGAVRYEVYGTVS